MSYYPLVTDDEQLKKMDRWFVSTFLNVIKLRGALLVKDYGVQDCNFPYNLTADNLIKLCKERRRNIDGKLVKAFEIPSFLRISKAIRLGIENEGILSIINPASDNYNY